MTEFLGIPINLIMIVLLALFLASVATVGIVYLRNRILFDIGLRNIPRRRAQSTLIVLGLMLSTVIIAAAFSTGDTVAYSITSDTYEKLGHVDEIVQVRGNRDTPSLTEEQIAPTGLIPRQVSDSITADLNGNDNVDGVLPGLRFPAPVVNRRGVSPDDDLLEPRIVIMGLDERRMAGFEQDIVLVDSGALFNVAQLRPSQALVNRSAAAALQLRVNDRVNVIYSGVRGELTVVGIVEDRYLTGWTQDEPAGIVMVLQSAALLTGNVSSTGFIAISNRGGVRDGLDGTDTVVADLNESLARLSGSESGANLTRFEPIALKQGRLDRARELGSAMTAIFVVLGLFSIAAGMLLIFLILVMLAAERRPEMGMSRAIGMKRLQLIETFLAEGMAYSVTSAAGGAALGVIVSLGMTRAMAYIFNRFDVDLVFQVTVQSLVISYCLGVVLTFATVVVSAWRVSRLNVVAAIREVNEPPPRATGRVSGAAGGLLVMAGAALLVLGIVQGAGWAVGAGVSLVLIGAAFMARFLGGPERWVFTTTGVAVVAAWTLLAGGNLNAITGDPDTGLETFFVGGVLMVAAATFIVLYNVELLLGGIRAVGSIFSRAVPAVRTSIAYPLANKARTGMTIAMLSLVVFSLVMISTMNLNFRRLFLSDDALGGWHVQLDMPVEALPDDDAGNKHGVLGELLDRAFYDTRKVEAIGAVFQANPATTLIGELPEDPAKEPDYKPFEVFGANDVFLVENQIGLQARATGFETDEEVWQAVSDDPNNAVIDGSAVPGLNYANVTESRFTLKEYESGQESFAPFPMRIIDFDTGNEKNVRIIGIMNRAPSETYRGLWINADAAFDAFSSQFGYVRFYIRLAPGADAAAEARAMEGALAQRGAAAVSIQDAVEDDQALSSAFFYLVQGFMALGLGVGLAALGVIAFRTVVERRQQIGLMRAIGFSRANVALTFMLESAFIAVLGIVNGIWLALLLANRLLSSEEFSTAGFTTFHVPWLQIGLMAILVFVASVLTTLIPSRQASGIPPADALRYE